MDINLIGVPIKYGCDREGVQFGPDKLREFGIIDIIKRYHNNVYDIGNLFIPYVHSDDKYKHHREMKYFDPVVEVNTNLAHAVYCSLKSNFFPFIIGGDHSLGMGSIAGSSKFFKDIAVIWIDAHGDINDHKTSPSGNIHGMPLAVSMGVGHEDLTGLYFQGTKVNPKDVYIIGARDLDEGEIQLAKDLNLNLYTMESVREEGIDTVVKKVIENIRSSKVEAVHLSFDIDVLDSNIIPGTGTPVKDGFTVEESKLVLRDFLKEGFVKSMDFVELNPKLDIENKTAHICIDLIDYIFKHLK